MIVDNLFDYCSSQMFNFQMILSLNLGTALSKQIVVVLSLLDLFISHGTIAKKTALLMKAH